jgi:DNA-directed RNA polymerase specialized sigma24 family protein
MPPAEGGSITQFFARLRAGDAAAAQPLWEHFLPRLRRLAEKSLAGRPQRVADAEDAVLSAFASFWQRAERGDFHGPVDRHGLWNLLGLITVRKALKQARREGARKRGGGRVRGETDLAGPGADEFRLEEALGRMPAHDFDLHCEELLLLLDEEARDIAVLRLMGYTNREIADLHDCTERKVERKLNLIRLKWEGAVAGE